MGPMPGGCERGMKEERLLATALTRRQQTIPIMIAGYKLWVCPSTHLCIFWRLSGIDDVCWSATSCALVSKDGADHLLQPAVNVVQHVFVPVEQKTVVGSLVGLGWGTFLALRAS